MSIRPLILGVCLLGVPGVLLAQVSGTVRQEGSNTPIAGALVSVQATGTRVATAADGTFLIPGVTGPVVLVAAIHGSYNEALPVTAPATGIDLFLEPVLVEDDASYQWFDPQDCGACHPDQYAQWNGSPMQKGGLNTWVYDIYDGSGTPGGLGGFVYERDSVHALHNPHSECAACHQPMPWIEQPGIPMLPLDAITAGMAHGISCEVCHKVAAVDPMNINFPGVVPEATTFIRPSLGNQVQFGMLGDASYSLPGVMRPAYNPQLAAEVCGLCHQDKNDPDEDGDFEEANGVISEPTYWEWKNSPYGDLQSPFYRSCVDCHMPPAGPDQACNFLVPPLLRDPSTIRTHDIRGTTPEFLENSVSLSLATQVVGNQLVADVTIVNDQVGHHVPTGVTVRNMILIVEARRVEDGLSLLHTGSQTVHPLGGVGDPAQGYYAGLPGKLFAKVNAAASGQSPTFFTDAVTIVFDSRIEPLATDVTSYPFLLPAGGGTLEVRARVIYRRAWRAIVDAKGWTEDGHGNPLGDVQPPHFGHLMEEALATEALPYTAPEFRRGDSDGDETITIADAVSLLAFLFVPGSDAPLCGDAADANDDGGVDIADPVRILMVAFEGGSLPGPGGTDCGPDPTADAVPCTYSTCP